MKQSIVTIYGRTGCHLCEKVVETLNPLQSDLNFQIEEILIDNDVELEKLYGQLIPVVHIDGKHFTHFHLDVMEFKSFLEKHHQHQ